MDFFKRIRKLFAERKRYNNSNGRSFNRKKLRYNQEKHLPALLVQRVTRARINNEIADSDFMYQTIQRDFLTYISMNKTETAVPHLSLNDIKNFGIMVPTLLEKKMIGSFFANLDRLITLHQRKQKTGAKNES